MTEAKVVYTGVSHGARAPRGDLFAGMKFWLTVKLPLRSRFVVLVTSNGGEIVPLEQQADYKIVDHLIKKNIPPDSFSYTFIEESIRKGELQDPEDHRAGPKVLAPRPVGSHNTATKGTRTAFTAEDDQVLYEWVTGRARSGGRLLGNVIYQQLAEANTRHTWQSWRDRWVKYVGPRHPPSEYPIYPANLPSSPQVDRSPKKVSKPSAATPPLQAAVSKARISSAVSQPSDKGKSREHQEPSHSPTYQPASPAKRLRRKHDRQTEAAEERPDSPELPSASTAPRTMPTVIRNRKRKHSRVDEDEAEVADLLNAETRKPKRRRRRQDEDEREIPSTPEPGPLSSPPPYSTLDPSNYSRTSKIGPYGEPEMLELEPRVTSQTLSHPDRDDDAQGQPAQALLHGPTQDIDFDIPEPPGGWDDLPPEGTENSTPSTEAVHQLQTQDTQALLHGPTQAIDFELAKPEGGWDQILPDVDLLGGGLAPIAQPLSEDADQTDEQLEAWIDARVAAGASEANVLYALKRSSMFTGLAELVLESLVRGQGVPRNVKGIWTETEDEALKGGDGRAIKKLEEKHGKEAFQERWNFLTMYDQMDGEA